MKKIIKIVFCSVLLYFLTSLSFVSSIDFGQRLENCDSVKKWELENFPSVTYCSYPIIEMKYANDEAPGEENPIIALHYFVFVNRPKDNIDVEMMLDYLSQTFYDFEIEQLIGQKSLHIDQSTNRLIANFDGSFMMTIPFRGTLAEYTTPLKIEASSDKVLINTVAAEYPIPGLKNDCEDFIKSVVLSQGIIPQMKMHELDIGPEIWGISNVMGIGILNVLPGNDKVIWAPEIRLLDLTRYASQIEPYKANPEGFVNFIETLVSDSTNLEVFTKEGVLHNEIIGRIPSNLESLWWYYDSTGTGKIDTVVIVNPLVHQEDTGIFPTELFYGMNDAFRKNLRFRSKGNGHTHIFYKSEFTQADDYGVAFESSQYDDEFVYKKLYSFQDKKWNQKNFVKSATVQKWQELHAKGIQASDSVEASGDNIHDAVSIVGGSPEDPLDEFLRISMDFHWQHFEYFSELSLLTNTISANLESLATDPSNPTYRNNIYSYMVRLVLLRDRIPVSIQDQNLITQLVGDDGQGGLIGDLLNDLGDVYNNGLNNERRIRINGHLAGMQELSNVEGVQSWEWYDQVHKDLLLRGIILPETRSEKALIYLVKIDSKLTKINAFLDNPLAFTLKRIFHKNDPKFAETLSNPQEIATSKYGMLKSFAKGFIISIVLSFGGQIRELGERTGDMLLIGIGWAMQIYSYARTIVYVLSVAVKIAILWILEGVRAAIMFGFSTALSFAAGYVAGYIVGQILGLIINAFLVRIYCILYPLACDPCSINPAYKDNEEDETPDLLLPNKAYVEQKGSYVEGKLKYTLCGLKYCNPEKFTVNLYTESKKLGDAECSSNDWGCFNCELSHNKRGDLTVTAAVEHVDHGVKFWSESKTVRVDVCPSPYLIDPEFNQKCIGCNGPIESSTLEDTPDNKCDSVCGASPECDEVSPGTTWCEENFMKTCDLNCQYSYEECGTTEDSDGGINTLVYGTLSGGCYQLGEEISCLTEGLYEDFCLDSTLYEFDTSLESELINCKDYGPLWTCSSGRCVCLSDVNSDRKINIMDISIVAKAYGTKPEDERWNPEADLDENNLINIIDISMIAKDFGRNC